MINVFFDGGCFPNPGGKATWGYIVKFRDGKEHYSYGVYGNGPGMTNNLAEYRGIIESMYFLEREGFVLEDILFRGDSALVINQMKGRYRIPKNDKPYADHAREAYGLRKKFTAAEFEWIPRESNTEADALTEFANTAPDSAPVG